MQNYIEFNGGGRGSNSKANRVRGRPLQKKAASEKKRYFSLRLSHHNISLQRAYHMHFRDLSFTDLESCEEFEKLLKKVVSKVVNRSC